MLFFFFFFFKQKTAYEMRISDWSSDVCSSDLSYPRVQIGRLRKALDSHYGHNAPVNGLRFELRPGSYEIHFIETQAGRGGGSTQMFPPAGGSQGRLGSGTLVWFLTLQIGRASCRERVCQYV